MSIPDFFVVVPPRSGSTWLFKNLKEHPDIFIPEMKELKYFSNYLDMCDLDWYMKCFQKGGDKLKGEISPSYCILPDERIKKIKEIMPELRIIMIFRDPVERMWSHLKHQFRLKESVFAFCDGTFDEISEEKLIECLTSTWMISYSDYSLILKRWLNYYPKEQIYIDFFDNIIARPKEFLTKIFQYFHLSADIDWSLISLNEIVNKGLDKRLPDKLKEILLSLQSIKTNEFSKYLMEEYKIEIPENWKYIIEVDKNIKEYYLHDIFIGQHNNHRNLSNVLLMETNLCSHVIDLLDELYKGYKIIAFRSDCIALSKDIANINIAEVNKSDYERLKREKKIICATTLKELLNAVDDEIAHKNKIDQLEKDNDEKNALIEILRYNFNNLDAKVNYFLKDEIEYLNTILEKINIDGNVIS